MGNLGFALWETGALAEPETYLWRAILLCPGQAAAHFDLRIVLHGLHHAEEAAAATRQIIMLDAAPAAALSSLAIIPGTPRYSGRDGREPEAHRHPSFRLRISPLQSRRNSRVMRRPRLCASLSPVLFWQAFVRTHSGPGLTIQARARHRADPAPKPVFSLEDQRGLFHYK